MCFAKQRKAKKSNKKASKTNKNRRKTKTNKKQRYSKSTTLTELKENPNKPFSLTMQVPLHKAMK